MAAMADRQRSRASRKRKRDSDDSADSDTMKNDVESSARDDSSNSDSEEEEEEWQGPSEDGEEEEEDEMSNDNTKCCFCGGDESQDPSLSFESPLECIICSAFAHRHCARNAAGPGVLEADNDNDEGAKEWRCPSCHGLDIELEEPAETARPSPRRTSSRQEREKPTTPSRRPRLRESPKDAVNGNNDTIETPRQLRKRKSEEFDHSAVRFKRSPWKAASETPYVSDAANHEDAEDDEENDSSIKRSSRRSRKARNPDESWLITIKKATRKIIVKMRFEPGKLTAVLTGKPPTSTQPTEPMRRSNRAPVLTASENALLRSLEPAQPATTYSNYTYEYYVSMDDEKIKPYGGILSDADADTAKTLPYANDRLRFDRAKEEADKERAQRELAAASKRKLDMTLPKNAASQTEPTRATALASKINCIHFGGFEIDTWYAAPYPEEYSRNSILYICEFCLKYMNSEYISLRHKMKCPHKHPPGDEIYRDGSISIFEVDGRKNPTYCQNLCLLAKLFLGSKTLYYDVEPFLFYVMTESDDTGCHFVGYFSKEKNRITTNNVSCILTLPIHQRKGYGNLLIDFSYLLTRTENKTGSPEKPLSDLGLVSYRNYWKLVLCYELRQQEVSLTIKDISARTGMTPDDVICGLEYLNALVRDPVTKTYALRLDKTLIEAHIEKWESKGYVKINPKALTWTPFIMGRHQYYLEVPPTIAPRAEEPELQDGVLVDEIEMSDVDEEEDSPEETAVEERADLMEVDNNTKQLTVDGDGGQDLTLPSPRRSPSRAYTPPEPIYTEEEPYSTPPRYVPLPPVVRPETKKAATPPPQPLLPKIVVEPVKKMPARPVIPPTRFQIVPPLPGSVKKPRSPSRRRRVTDTPSLSRRKTSPNKTSVARPTGSLRHTRSTNNGEDLVEPILKGRTPARQLFGKAPRTSHGKEPRSSRGKTPRSSTPSEKAARSYGKEPRTSRGKAPRSSHGVGKAPQSSRKISREQDEDSLSIETDQQGDSPMVDAV